MVAVSQPQHWYSRVTQYPQGVLTGFFSTILEFPVGPYRYRFDYDDTLQLTTEDLTNSGTPDDSFGLWRDGNSLVTPRELSHYWKGAYVSGEPTKFLGFNGPPHGDFHNDEFPNAVGGNIVYNGREYSTNKAIAGAAIAVVNELFDPEDTEPGPIDIEYIIVAVHCQPPDSQTLTFFKKRLNDWRLDPTFNTSDIIGYTDGQDAGDPGQAVMYNPFGIKQDLAQFDPPPAAMVPRNESSLNPYWQAPFQQNMISFSGDGLKAVWNANEASQAGVGDQADGEFRHYFFEFEADLSGFKSGFPRAEVSNAQATINPSTTYFDRVGVTGTNVGNNYDITKSIPSYYSRSSVFTRDLFRPAGSGGSLDFDLNGTYDNYPLCLKYVDDVVRYVFLDFTGSITTDGSRTANFSPTVGSFTRQGTASLSWTFKFPQGASHHTINRSFSHTYAVSKTGTEGTTNGTYSRVRSRPTSNLGRWFDRDTHRNAACKWFPMWIDIDSETYLCAWLEEGGGTGDPGASSGLHEDWYYELFSMFKNTGQGHKIDQTRYEVWPSDDPVSLGNGPRKTNAIGREDYYVRFNATTTSLTGTVGGNFNISEVFEDTYRPIPDILHLGEIWNFNAENRRQVCAFTNPEDGNPYLKMIYPLFGGGNAGTYETPNERFISRPDWVPQASAIRHWLVGNSDFSWRRILEPEEGPVPPAASPDWEERDTVIDATEVLCLIVPESEVV